MKSHSLAGCIPASNSIGGNPAVRIKNPSHPDGTQMIMRWVGPPMEERLELENSDQVEGFWKRFVAPCDWFDHSKESVILIALDTRLRFLGWHLVSTGSAGTCMCEPREVLRAALCMDAWGIVLVHNHPSGVASPSRQDERLTRHMVDACNMVGVKLQDHVIVDSPGTTSYSFRSAFGDAFVGCGVKAAFAPPAPPREQPKQAADSSRPNAIESAGPGLTVKLVFPRSFRWNHPLSNLQGALFSAVAGGKAREWVERWNTGSSLKKHLKRVGSFKKQIEMEFILAAADFEQLELAAAAIHESPATLLSAIMGEAESSLATGKKVEAAKQREVAPPSKILQFVR